MKNTSLSKVKKPGFVKIKKGLKVACVIDRNEGDDNDGVFDKVLTIEEVKTKGIYTYVRYKEYVSEYWDDVYSYVKVEK